MLEQGLAVDGMAPSKAGEIRFNFREKILGRRKQSQRIHHCRSRRSSTCSNQSINQLKTLIQQSKSKLFTEFCNRTSGRELISISFYFCCFVSELEEFQSYLTKGASSLPKKLSLLSCVQRCHTFFYCSKINISLQYVIFLQ